MNEISVVLKTLGRNLHRFTTPALTEIAERSNDPYKVLVSCILSLRTRDETTAKASGRLYKLAGTPREMLKLSTKQIEKAIYPVGFYRVKSRRIKEISKILIGKHKGKVPDNMEDLLALPGVGRKTANIVMVYAHRKEGLPIDTHCHRVPNRLGWISTKTPEQTEQELRKILPRKHWDGFNNIIVQFGQNICKPVRPKCNACPVARYCRYYKNVYAKKHAERQLASSAAEQK